MTDLEDRNFSCDLSNKTLDIILDSPDESNLIGNTYELKEKLGQGSFGQVYRAINIIEVRPWNKNYAIKLEPLSDKKQHLLKEYDIYNTLNDSDNFSKIYWYGNYKKYRALVLDQLGPSLKHLFIKNKYDFDMNTIANIAVQFLYRLQELHNAGYLHQDIKPENILVDLKNMIKIYMIDFGTSDKWQNFVNRKHVLKVPSNRIVGTARYSSINNHKYMSQSRRDDLESFGYVLIYFAKSSLPWQGLKTKSFKIKWKKVLLVKENMNEKKLCSGLPKCFFNYFFYVNNLTFEQTPNYKYLRRLFRSYIKTDFFWKKN